MIGINQSYARSMASLPSPIASNRKSGEVQTLNLSAKPKLESYSQVEVTLSHLLTEMEIKELAHLSFTASRRSMQPDGGFLSTSLSNSMIFFVKARSAFLCLIFSDETQQWALAFAFICHAN